MVIVGPHITILERQRTTKHTKLSAKQNEEKTKHKLELLEKSFPLIRIHSMQGTTRHGVTRNEAQKRLKGTENLFRKNPQLKDVC